MSNALSLILPPILGALFGLFAMIGLVSSQTSTPDKNPASQSPLIYGE